MRFEVLGPLRVCGPSGAIRIGGPMRRQLLAALLCRVGRSATAEELIDDLWGDAPPRTAAKTLQSHVVRLRDDLGRVDAVTAGDGVPAGFDVRRASALVTTEAGYHLEVAEDEVDALRFERAVDAARVVATREPARAISLLRDALGLWRAEAYQDVGQAAFVVNERLRLTELRGAALELETDLQLGQGAAAELVPSLEVRVAVDPYRERSWEQLMLALYRCGRQADALGAYRRVREQLAVDLAVEPGNGLRELEGQILRGDPSLMTPEPACAGRVDHGECPYRGLGGYSDRDAALFVGRERLTAELAGLIAEHRVVVVTGTSGSGKSSLLRAGLLPALRAGAAPGSGRWHVAIRTAAELEAAVPASLHLLVLDQVEELFLDTPDRAARVADQLLAAVRAGTRLVLAVRGDFVGRLAELGGLASLARTTLLVRALRDDEVRRVVLEPAARCGLRVDPDLVDAVLDDISGQPAALPLLAVALVRAWANRADGVLTLAGYRRGGGIAAALQATAEDVYRALPPDQARAARHLLPRMAAQHGASWVRRPLGRADLAEGPSTQAVAALVRGRLAIATDDRVELVHDALLTRWPRLHDWLVERERVADLLDGLASAARAWRADGDDVGLYRGARLQVLREWAAEHEVDAVERDFLAASAAAADAELAAARARADREAAGRRRLRMLVAVLLAVLVLAVAGGAVALRERSTARAQARRADQTALLADARRLAALSLSAPDLRTSLLLAAAAYRLQDSPDTRSALLTAVETGRGAKWRLPTANRLQWLRTDLRADTVWTFDDQGEVLRVDAATHRIVGRFPLRGGAANAVSPDGRSIVDVADDTQPGADGVGGEVVVQDARTGAVLAAPRIHAFSGGFAVPTAAYTADGRWLAVIESGDRSADRPSSRLAVFSAGDLSAKPRVLDVGSPITGIGTGRRDIAVATSGGDVLEVDAARVTVTHRARRAGLPVSTVDGGTPVALAPDGSRIAVGQADGVTALVLPAAGLSGPGVRVEGAADLATLAFSPSGRLVATGSEDGTVAVADARTGAIQDRFADSGPVHGLAWGGTSDAGGLFSGGLDSELTEWALGGTPPMFAQSGPFVPTTFDFRTGGRVVGASGVLSGGAQLGFLARVAAAPSTRTWSLHLTERDSVNQEAGDASGRTAVLTVGEPRGGVSCEVLDTSTGRLRARLALPVATDSAQACAVSRDGRTLAASVSKRRIAFYALPGLRRESTIDVRPTGQHGDRVQVAPLWFAPDGRLIVQGLDPGPAPLPAPVVGSTAAAPALADQRLLDVDPRTGRVFGEISLGPDGTPWDVEWNADGTRLAVATGAGRVYLVEARRFVVTAQAPAAAGFAISASFSPDGSTIVTGGTDGTMRFFDGRTLQPIGQPIRLASQNWWQAFYVGHQVVGFAPATEDDQRWFRFPGDPAVWRQTACRLAGTPFTRAEWRQYVGNRPYQDECGS